MHLTHACNAPQPLPSSFPVHLWYDADAGRMRMDVYNGLDRVIQVRNQGATRQG